MTHPSVPYVIKNGSSRYFQLRNSRQQTKRAIPELGKYGGRELGHQAEKIVMDFKGNFDNAHHNELGRSAFILQGHDRENIENSTEI